MFLLSRLIRSILDFIFVRKISVSITIKELGEEWLVIADYGDGTSDKSLMPDEMSARQMAADYEYWAHRESYRRVWYNRPWTKEGKAMLKGSEEYQEAQKSMEKTIEQRIKEFEAKEKSQK